MNDIFKGKKPAACLAGSDLEKEVLLDIALKLSRGDRFILLMRNTRSLEDRLLPAFMNALLRYSEKSMRSESLQKEVLLFAAGTMNIGKAISNRGIVDPREFVAFASGRALLDTFIRLSHSRITKQYKLSVKWDSAREAAMAGLVGDA